VLTRRRFLQGSLAAGAAAVAACTAGPSASPPGTPVTVVPSASPSLAPSPSPIPSPQLTPAVSPGRTLRQTIAGLLVVGIHGTAVGDIGPLADSVRRDRLAGVILFGKNITSPSQLKKLTGGLRALAPGRRLVISIDQEGGEVARLNPTNGFPATASEESIGKANDAAKTRAWAGTIAGMLEDSGIDLNLAPVVDLNVNPTNPAVGALDRSFSANPDVVSRLSTIEIDVHHEHGVLTALKHFPGLGSATVNTDFGVSDVTATWTRTELAPYRDLIDSGTADVIMAAHLVNRKLDPDHPASLSRPIVTDLLRGELGWDGVVITDSLNAAAITDVFGQKEAIALAIEAGNDLLLFSSAGTVADGIVDKLIDIVEAHVASGRITRQRLEASRARIERLWPG